MLQGVRVRLLDAAGQPLGPATVTDAAGHYAFLNLQAGSYRVGYAPLIGTAFTAQDRGADEAIDSDASPVNGVSSLLVTLAPGVSDLRGGAGLVLDPGARPTTHPFSAWATAMTVIPAPIMPRSSVAMAAMIPSTASAAMTVSMAAPATIMCRGRKATTSCSAGRATTSARAATAMPC
nr:SdrD B-like domain-containing protein [Pseudoroseomonas vastitatis]